MFGYIAINKAEMKFKDYDMYHSYYCGLLQMSERMLWYKRSDDFYPLT